MPLNKHKIPSRTNEQGNAFIIVLLAVTLFAALAFTVSRGMQSQTTNALSSRELDLAVSDILTYAQRMERAVDRVRRHNCSETQISFDNPIVAGYTHGAAPPTKCEVFNSAGGGITWKSPPEGVNDGSEWVITAGSRLIGVGDTNKREIILVLPNVDLNVCNQINSKMNINLAASPPADTATADVATKFTGTAGTGNPALGFSGAPGTIGFDGLTTACFEGGGTPAASTYHFYHVLLVR